MLFAPAEFDSIFSDNPNIDHMSPTVLRDPNIPADNRSQAQFPQERVSSGEVLDRVRLGCLRLARFHLGYTRAPHFD